MHALRRCCPLLFFTVLVLGFAGCGGGGNSQSAAPTPVFTSTPVQTAVEGSPYSYQLAASDSAGNPITYALTSAPDGATLNGNTITWTPTTAQSRVANSFTVTARSSTGGSATQTWTVTPNGTVRVSWVLTYWSPSGPVDVPHDWTIAPQLPSALVPQLDGSFQTLAGTVGADGTFTIPNVPAGYYWLRLSPQDMYWTNSSHFDAGADLLGAPGRTTGAIGGVSSTKFSISFRFQGLEPVPGPGAVQCFFPESGGSFLFQLPPDSSSLGMLTFMNRSSNVNYSQLSTAFLLQYEPVSLGPLNAFVLGPALTLSDLSLNNEGDNTISGTLLAGPLSSLNLAIKGSAWKPLFDNVAPVAAAPLQPSFTAWVSPFANRNTTAGTGVRLFADSGQMPLPSVSTGSGGASTTWGDFGPSLPASSASPFADLDLGNVQYRDPFPSSWQRRFQILQRATVQIPLPDSTPTEPVTLTNWAITPLPDIAAGPLLSPVQDPTINGSSLFTPATLNATDPTLSWLAPALGSPHGYRVQVMAPGAVWISTGGTPPSTKKITTLRSVATLSTAKTSLVLPPSIIAPGGTYLFMITAVADAGASMETSPHRSALPVASADLISAPITIGSAGQ